MRRDRAECSARALDAAVFDNRADGEVDALEARYMTEDKFNELRKAYTVAAAMEPFSSVVDTSNLTEEQVCQEVLLIVRSHLVPFGRLV